MAMLPRLRQIASIGLVLVGLVLASSISAQQAGNKAAVDRMHQHLTTLDAVQYAVVRGALDDAKAASQQLSDQLSMDGLPPDGQKHLSDLKAAAIAGTKAASVEDAGAQTGKMTVSCGGCHAALGKPVKIAEPAKPEGQPSLKTRMNEHDYAVKLLSAGLRGPSDEMWRQGADSMKKAKLWTITLKDAELSKQVNGAETTFRALADKAVNAKDPAAKGAVYGEVLATCGHCHSLGGRVFGPGVPK
jgi:cytochrome c553